MPAASNNANKHETIRERSKTNMLRITKNIFLSPPVPFGGPAPMYSLRTSPLPTSEPGILPTSQCCHSRNFGSLRLGASGSGSNYYGDTISQNFQ